MAEPKPPQPQQPTGAKAQILNDRTYQEVEYLKKCLGPILVAALAEICIRRPVDPIEYLGHWLLRWRYNEELKRRDVQNALEVVRQKAWTKDDENLAANPAAPDQAPAPESFTQGFVPGSPYAPPGYGGPLDANAVAEPVPPPEDGDVPAEEEPVVVDAVVGEEEGVESGGAEEGAGEEKRPSMEGEKRGSAAPRLSQQGGSGEVKRASETPGPEGARGSQAGEGKRGSQVEEKRGSQAGEVRRPSQMEDRRPSQSGGSKRASMEKRPSGDPGLSGQPVDSERRPSGEKAGRPSGEIAQDTNNPEEAAEPPAEEPSAAPVE